MCYSTYLTVFKVNKALSYVRINHQIRSAEVRLIGAEGENIGVVSLSEALKLAQEAGLDLIEISPNTAPPIAKIADYGKFQYDQNKKQKHRLKKQRLKQHWKE